MTLTQDLSRPFDKRFVEQVRKTGGREEDFVNHAVVTGRLNDVLGVGNWSFRVVDTERYDVDGLPHVAFVVGEIALGDAVRQDIGVPSNVVVREYVNRDGRTIHVTTVQDEVKTAVSDALKRCAMRLGVAIQLWHDIEATGAGQAPVPSAPPALSHTDARAEQGTTAVLAVAEGESSGGGEGELNAGEGSSSPPSDTLAQLLEAVDGNEIRAVNKINKAVGGGYRKEDLENLTPDEWAAGLAAATMGGPE